MGSTEQAAIGERADLLETLRNHQYFLRYTVRDLTNEQAARRTTVSELCLGGLIKHVAATERGWINFILDGPSALGPWDEASITPVRRVQRAGGRDAGRAARRLRHGEPPDR